MTVRYIGLLLIFLACTFVGFALSGNESGRLENNESLLILFRFIYQKLSYFHASIFEIYDDFENERLEKIGFCKILKKKGLVEALLKCHFFDLDKITNEALLQTAKQLGQAPLGEQLASCQYVIERLEENNKNLQQLCPTRKKIYSSLGMLCGIMAVILFL
jgi:stage III sporulation protein AB